MEARMLCCSHVTVQLEDEALVHQNEILWPVAKAEAEMRAQTSPWWVSGTTVHEIPAGDGVLWLAETPDGCLRLLSHTKNVPVRLLTLLRQGLPVS